MSAHPAAMINVAVIGVSGFGARHYLDLIDQVQLGHARIVAATVINQDQEAEKCAKLRALGCELFTDHREMLAHWRGRIDLCCIPTGIPLHAPMTIDALRAGANVFVEKPAAAVIQDVRAMQAAERETGKFVAVGFQTVFARETMLMKRTLVAEELGPVRSIACRGLWPRFDHYYARNGWAGRLKHGNAWILDSPFNNAVAHQLAMICFLAGSTIEAPARLASIRAELYRGHAIESADTACLRLLTERGIPLWFLVTHCSEGHLDPEIEVRCERGRLRWTFTTLRIDRPDGSSEEHACETGDALRRSLHDALRRRIADPRAFICSLDIAAAQTLAVNGAHESSVVHDVPTELVRRLPQEPSIKTVITGIDDLIARAFSDEKSFSELGVPWAHAGREVSLAGYESFPS